MRGNPRFSVYFYHYHHMAKIAYKYTLPDSHTWIKLEENEPKVKVVTGEIIEIEEGLVNKMRMYMGGFRQVGEDGEAKVEQFDAVNAENAEKEAEEAKEAKKASKKAKEVKVEEEAGNEVPEIVVPTTSPEATVETEVVDDGSDAVTIKVTK